MRRLETIPTARRRWLHRLVGTVLSVGGHGLILLAMLRTPGLPEYTVPEHEPAVVTVSLMPASPPPGPPAKKPASPPPTPKPPEEKPKPKPTPKKPVTGSKPAPQAKAEPASAEAAAAQSSMAELSEGQLAGANTAASGPPGGQCNMPRLLQTALRGDPRVQAAVARVHRGKALLVWDGSWVRSSDEDGDGLAGVREAIMVEVAFAPAACKAEPVNGLVLISMKDGPGGGRLAMGQSRWRWQDLLNQRAYGR